MPQALRGALERMLDGELADVRRHAINVIDAARQRGLPVATGTIEKQVTSLGSLPIEQLDRLGNRLYRLTTATAGTGAATIGFFGIFGLPAAIYADIVKTIEITSRFMCVYGFYPDEDFVELWLGLAAALNVEPHAASARQVMLHTAARRVAVSAASQARDMIMHRITDSSIIEAPAYSIPGLGAVTGGLTSTGRIYAQGRRAKRYYRDARLAAS